MSGKFLLASYVILSSLPDARRLRRRALQRMLPLRLRAGLVCERKAKTTKPFYCRS